MVLQEGVEPSIPYGHLGLSQARMPIPPPEDIGAPRGTRTPKASRPLAPQASMFTYFIIGAYVIE